MDIDYNTNEDELTDRGYGIVDEEEMNLGSDSGDDGSFSDEDFSEGEPIDFGEDE